MYFMTGLHSCPLVHIWDQPQSPACPLKGSRYDYPSNIHQWIFGSMYIVLLAWSARLLELPQTRQSALLGEQALSTLCRGVCAV